MRKYEIRYLLKTMSLISFYYAENSFVKGKDYDD